MVQTDFPHGSRAPIHFVHHYEIGTIHPRVSRPRKPIDQVIVEIQPLLPTMQNEHRRVISHYAI